MARDIEEFLRRAAERRKKQQQQQQGGARRPAQPPQRRQPPVQRQPVRQPPRQPPKQRPNTLVDRKEIEFVTPKKKPHDFRNESVQEHVKHYINTEDIAEHAEHLGEHLSQTDERVEERIHKKFDHSVGSLSKRPSVTDSITESTGDDIAPIAQDLLELLSKPKTIRQAILVAEILRRPNFDED